jgi:hypothetical protein
MCFSTSASMIAGVTLGMIGRETVKKPKVITDYPYASIPLIFSVQQFTEGAVWFTINMPVINHILAFVYLFFAYVVWPVFVPIAVLLMENNPLRQKSLKLFAVLGMITGLTLLYSILSGPVEAQIIQNSLSYSSIANYPPGIFWMYLAATGVSCLVSGHRMVTLFGITILIASFTSWQCYANTFISVWCFFSAILSFIVYLHFQPVGELVRGIKARLNIA